MIYRVYDKKEKTFIRENIYISPCDDIFISVKNKLFGATKLKLVPSERYISQCSIGLHDINRRLIYEGDICKIDRLSAIGIIAYVPEYASYFLLDDENLKYYPLSEERCKEIEIIGNIFTAPIQVDDTDNSTAEETNVNIGE